MAGTIRFTPATREQSRGRLLMFGPSGSGKTYTGLLVASNLVEPGEPFAVIDSEHGSAAKYADEFTFHHYVMRPPYHPEHYINAIKAAEQAGFKSLLIDSITHEWDGEGGVKEIVDASKSQFGGNSQAAWSIGTPLHNKFLEAILAADCHIVATARSKTEWVPGEDARGKKIFIKVGMEPKQRDTIEYEFDLAMLLDMDNNGTVTKSRVRPFPPQTLVEKPGHDFAKVYLRWLQEGTTAKPSPAGDVRATGKEEEALREEARDTIYEIQNDFGDYDTGKTWADRMAEKCQEWFSAPLEQLDAQQLNTLLTRLRTTRAKLAEARDAAPAETPAPAPEGATA